MTTTNKPVATTTQAVTVTPSTAVTPSTTSKQTATPTISRSTAKSDHALPQTGNNDALAISILGMLLFVMSFGIIDLKH